MAKSLVDVALKKAATALVKSLDRVVDDNLPEEIAEIVKFHSSGAAVAGVASGWIPGASGAALAVVSAGFIWTMYGRINSEINLPFSENVVKSLASGVATNLASYAVASIVVSTVLSLIPGIGSMGATIVVGATCYALTLASGYVYLKLLTNLFSRGEDPTKISADDLQKEASSIAKGEDVKDFMKSAKSEYKSSQK